MLVKVWYYDLAQDADNKKIGSQVFLNPAAISAMVAVHDVVRSGKISPHAAATHISSNETIQYSYYVPFGLTTTAEAIEFAASHARRQARADMDEPAFLPLSEGGHPRPAPAYGFILDLTDPAGIRLVRMKAEIAGRYLRNGSTSIELVDQPLLPDARPDARPAAPSSRL